MGLNGKLAGPGWTLRNKRHFVVSDFAVEDFYCIWTMLFHSAGRITSVTFMQTEVVFLGHIVGRTGLACDPAKLSAVRNWHASDKVRGVQQFVGFVGYYRRFVKDFADLAEPLVALTRKGAPFVWTDRQQLAFEALKACLISAPFLGFRVAICVGHGCQFICCRRGSEPFTG